MWWCCSQCLYSSEVFMRQVFVQDSRFWMWCWWWAFAQLVSATDIFAYSDFKINIHPWEIIQHFKINIHPWKKMQDLTNKYTPLSTRCCSASLCNRYLCANSDYTISSCFLSYCIACKIKCNAGRINFKFNKIADCFEMSLLASVYVEGILGRADLLTGTI